MLFNPIVYKHNKDNLVLVYPSHFPKKLGKECKTRKNFFHNPNHFFFIVIIIHLYECPVDMWDRLPQWKSRVVLSFILHQLFEQCHSYSFTDLPCVMDWPYPPLFDFFGKNLRVLDTSNIFRGEIKCSESANNT